MNEQLKVLNSYDKDVLSRFLKRLASTMFGDPYVLVNS